MQMNLKWTLTKFLYANSIKSAASIARLHFYEAFLNILWRFLSFLFLFFFLFWISVTERKGFSSGLTRRQILADSGTLKHKIKPRIGGEWEIISSARMTYSAGFLLSFSIGWHCYWPRPQLFESMQLIGPSGGEGGGCLICILLNIDLVDEPTSPSAT